MRSARRELRNSVGVILCVICKDDFAAAYLNWAVGGVFGNTDIVRNERDV